MLAHQAITHPATAKGAEIDVSVIDSLDVACYHASVEATVNTNPGTFLIQGSPVAADDEDWATLFEFTASDGTADTEAMTATEPIGETVLVVVSTTGFAAGDGLYVQDAGVMADSEWAKCKKIVTNTSIDLIDGLTTGKDASDFIWNDAEVFSKLVDCRGKMRLRIVFQHEGAVGANVHVKALGVSADSFG
jgi:hypothetical protein